MSHDRGSGSLLHSRSRLGDGSTAALDTMRVMKWLGEATYARGIDLLEAIVARLTKMT
jgi:hypothetical protein